MARVITSPVKRWPGTVTLADPLNFEQVLAWEEAVEQAQDRRQAEAVGTEPLTLFEASATPAVARLFVPAVCLCVEQWSLEGLPDRVTPGTFPAAPRVPAVRLLLWLMGEIGRLIAEADELPNA